MNMTLSILAASLAQILVLAILLRSVLSWLPRSRTLAPVTGLLDDFTEPVLRPICRRMPMLGGLDLSPMLAIICTVVAESLLLGLLAGH
jgi:YggT family protein